MMNSELTLDGDGRVTLPGGNKNVLTHEHVHQDECRQSFINMAPAGVNLTTPPGGTLTHQRNAVETGSFRSHEPAGAE